MGIKDTQSPTDQIEEIEKDPPPAHPFALSASEPSSPVPLPSAAAIGSVGTAAVISNFLALKFLLLDFALWKRTKVSVEAGNIGCYFL